eukprot:scaffold583_cov279-Chaetoceros_neogracile.AAC.40
MNGNRVKCNSFISQHVPVLARKELCTTRVLGSGGFCSVSVIQKVTLQCEQETNLGIEEKDARRRLSKRFDNYYDKYYSANNIVVPGYTPAADPLEQKPPRIALKELKSSLQNERYRIGAKDLINEIAILSKCSHPNIITLYAVGCDDKGSDDYSLPSTMIANRKLSFAIIDQLRSTLRNRIYKWKEDQGVSFLKSRKAQNDLWLERLVVMIKVADAISYLHSKGIMHRDLNPDNIGFADDNAVKLFDFGLAKSLENEDNIASEEEKQDSLLPRNEDELFDLTGTTGTLRYMAPEVALDMPYGFKADVHSLGLIMHESLSLTKPYIHVQPQNFIKEVMIEGYRPSMHDSWPTIIKDLISNMWSSNIARRPSSKEVVETLGVLLRGDDTHLYPSTGSWKLKMVTRFDNIVNICTECEVTDGIKHGHI